MGRVLDCGKYAPEVVSVGAAVSAAAITKPDRTPIVVSGDSDPDVVDVPGVGIEVPGLRRAPVASEDTGLRNHAVAIR